MFWFLSHKFYLVLVCSIPGEEQLLSQDVWDLTSVRCLDYRIKVACAMS